MNDVARAGIAAVAASAAVLLCGCAAESGGGTAPASRIVAPGPVITGGRSVPGVDASGTPLRQPGPITLFVNPTAIAAAGPDLYVVDSGLGAIVRVDVATDTLTLLRGRPFQPGTRIAVAGDLSLYVLDAANRRLLRFSRGGQALQTVAADATVGRPVDFALDAAQGRIVLADGLFRQLVVFHPAGRGFEVLPIRPDARHAVLELGAIALGQKGIYVSDPRCRCVALVARDGRVVDTFGHERIGLPGEIAVDRHERVFVADRLERKLKIFQGGALIEDVALAALGIADLAGLAIADDWMYVADGAARQVRMLRLLPPVPGR